MLSIAKILVVIAAALAITSGIWVATALLRTLIHSSNADSNADAENRS